MVTGSRSSSTSKYTNETDADMYSLCMSPPSYPSAAVLFLGYCLAYHLVLLWTLFQAATQQPFAAPPLLLFLDWQRVERLGWRGPLLHCSASHHSWPTPPLPPVTSPRKELFPAWLHPVNMHRHTPASNPHSAPGTLCCCWRSSLDQRCLALSPIQELCLLFGRLQQLEGAHESVINAHHSTSIVKLAAVVGCRENGHQLPARKKTHNRPLPPDVPCKPGPGHASAGTR